MDINTMRVPPDKPVKLSKYPTLPTNTSLNKLEAQAELAEGIRQLADMQPKLYAQNIYALLVVLQGMDAAGKDSTIRHVMSGVNPAGCQVRSFKVPSAEELDHDYLWRYVRALPQRGNIGIFNRSHYEEVLVVRVHPELLQREHIPRGRQEQFWRTRFEEINHFETYLERNGIAVLKFFLHISKEEQKKRFLERLNSPDKNWKFSEADVRERAHWDAYQTAYEDMLSHTSTTVAPWHVIPADKKWFARLAVSRIIVEQLRALGLDYPKLGEPELAALERARQYLACEE
ncbi:MAG: polyphosphate kinase 2 family protein [Pirellulales bacterium]